MIHTDVVQSYGSLHSHHLLPCMSGFSMRLPKAVLIRTCAVVLPALPNPVPYKSWFVTRKSAPGEREILNCTL